jgi:hypothetical protein
MSLVFVVVSEAAADFTTATELADRVLCEQIDWLDESLLDSQRSWISESPEGGSLHWKAISKLAREYGLRVHGHFAGEPGFPDAVAARKAIAYINHVLVRVDAVILVRDLDDQPERLAGLIQARSASHSPTMIVIGTANIERESWVLSGFVPTTPEEHRRLDAERQELGFNPCLQPQELKAGKNDQAKRSPKRVLSVLTSGDREREASCWQTTTLSVLRNQGGENGLRHYLQEVEQRLVPLVTGRSPSQP